MIKERKIESIRFETKAVIYQNETGFKILAGVAYNADSGEMLRKCSLKGQLSDVEDGDTLFVSGDWDEHPKYGVGFRAEAYVKAVPQDKKSMLAYLKHGNIAGISAKRAELIIDKFGDNAFDVLIYQPHLLEGIRGIGKKTIEKIKVSAKDKLETQNMIAQIMRYIQGFDISPAYSNKIYKQYGLDSIKVLKENPYRLADDIAGVGFLKADEIALKNGISETSPFRVESAVLYILRQMNKEGDVFSYIQDIEAEGKEFLNIFNGDIGKIVSIFSPELDAEMGINDDEMDDDIDKDEREGLKRGFIVDFDGNRVCFDNSRASDFILAYAITIHKSQGSEYDIVVMPLTMANYTMLQRNLLYTAVTRAKKIFVLFGQKNAVAKAVKNLKVVKRNTRLGLRIVNQMGLLDMMQPENVQLSIDGCGDPRPCLVHASVARGIMAV